jgi:hypothetical protein
MDANRVTSSTSSTLDTLINKINDLKNNVTNETKSNEIKSNEPKRSVRKSKTNNSNANQIPSSIARRIGLVYGLSNHLTNKKQTRKLKRWLDELIVKMELLANNEVDTESDSD